MTGGKVKVAVLAVFFLVVLCGCFGKKDPGEVAQGFWQAVTANDLATARKYAGGQSLTAIGQQNPYAASGVRYGEIRINGDQATVATIIAEPGEGKRELPSFATELHKVDGVWRVEGDATLANAAAAEADRLARRLRELQAMGDELARKFGEAHQDLKQEIPEMEKRLDQLGQAVRTGVDKAWNEYLPALKEDMEALIDAFQRSLEEALPSEPPADEPVAAPGQRI